MLTVSIDLGRIKVAGKKPNLSVTLSSSFSITLPSLWSGTPTAAELSQASSAGDIWVSKAGSCQIEVSTLINGQVPDSSCLDPGIMTAVVDFPSECSVWNHLGLGLRTNHASQPHPNQGQSHASYFLHHPDLSSGTIAPSNVPSAQFQGLRCEVNYGFGPSKSKVHTNPQTPELPPFGSMDCSQSAEETPQRHTYALRSNPKRSRKAAVAQEEASNASPSPLLTSNYRSPDYEQEDLESLVAEAIAEMACLLDVAFRKLVGVKGATPGTRTIKHPASPSLIDIAPAVWDLQYLQTMSAHAQAIPSIATGIARLSIARSSSLRQKLGSLTRQRTEVDDRQESADPEADIRDEVENRLWLLCQTRIRPEPSKRPFVTRKSVQNIVDQPPSQLDMEGQDWENPPLYVDIDSNVLGAVEDYDALVAHDPYVVLSQTLPQTGHLGAGALGQAAESYVMENGEPSSDELTHSSEGDYFYTDGQGNVYPIEREAAPEHSQTDWPSDPQLVNSDTFSQHQDEEVEEYWDEDPNRACIMYQEG